MLNVEVKTVKGIQTVPDFTTSVELDVDAYIPPSYIVNEQQKLDIYKRIARIESREECDDMLEELIDRSPGSPTIAPETDNRPAYDRKAEIAKDFE